MSIFGTILEKLGLKKQDKPKEVEDAKPAPASSHVDSRPIPASVAASKPTPAPAAPRPLTHLKPPAVTQTEKDVHGSAAMRPEAPLPGKPLEPAAAPMEMVDVVAKLEKMGKDAGGGLDWKASIVDLLKLLHIDSSLEARKELAVELGCPPELMKESRNMNIWLHKTVLQKLAENGGNIPKEMLD